MPINVSGERRDAGADGISDGVDAEFGTIGDFVGIRYAGKIGDLAWLGSWRTH
ncbi:MAG: hypothetical protein O7H39_08875 [Gammaproteobacteria bacterium]|nr:hypothetical protein [Gammaproteobacteria bacterium]